MDPTLTRDQVRGAGTQPASGMIRSGREQTVEALERCLIPRSVETLEHESEVPDRPVWTVERARRFRELCDKREVAKGRLTPQWKDALRPECASISVPSRPGDNLFVTVTVGGKEVSALIHTGSARTLLDASCFPPETLMGFRPAVGQGYHLLEASGNRIHTLGSWVAWVESGRIRADVVRGCPAKAILC